MSADNVIRAMRVLTSRPATVGVFLLSMFLWSATFLYVVPRASDGWFAPAVSIAFGLFGLIPGISIAVAVVVRVVRGQAITPPPEPVCPCCGEPVASASHGTPAAQ